ncbi:MAG: amino acid adenylation domain-containing protein [Bacteroidota bacterium]
MANRTQQELEGMIGFFVNTLALRTQVNEENSFQAMLQEVKQTTLGAYDHQQVPFEKVVERVVKTRDMSVSPLFQVLFVLQNTPDVESADLGNIEGIEFSHYKDQGAVTSKFDLTVTINEIDNQFSVNINYRTDLFKEETIERMLVHYQQLLTAIVASPSAQLSTVTMIQEEERTQLLDVYNDTFAGYPQDETVVALFEAQAKETPDAVAIAFEEESVTYQTLDERSNQVAHYLIDKGVSLEDSVGICLERSSEMMIAVLGILKSGGAYVPIDPAYPSERINYMIADASINILLTDSAIAETIPTNGVEELILADKDSGLINGSSTEPVSIDLTANNLAYIIYTSGSTGRPKGVQVEHRNIVSLATSCDYVALNKDTVWLSTGSISFDATTIEYWGTLLNGGNLILSTTETLLHTAELKALIQEKQVKTMWMTASWFHQVVAEDLSVFGSLEYLLVGGDIVLSNFTNQVKEQYPALTIINGYGPTENTTFSTTHSIEITDKALPIGKPIKNSYAYIINGNIDLVPVGVVGELVVGGSGVARGYLNQEELTNEKFVSNPFRKGDRLYKTGDLARWLPDGNIEFVGRKDNQVKIRGYRIELGEVEHALSMLSGVNQSCVLVKNDHNGEKQLIAYAVLEGNSDKAELQQALKQDLPDYMIPQHWIFLEEMPLNNNGKIDRKSLPEPDSSALSSKEYVAPATAIEVQLAAIWQDLLGVEKVGIHDNFFELGGHSLLATRLVSAIRKELEVEIAIRDVFMQNTLADLGNYLEQQDRGTLLPEVTRADHNLDKIPLSFSQERLWFLDQLQGSQEYHLPFALRISGDLDKQALSSSLQEIVNRHEVLRTVIYAHQGIGYQKVLTADDWDLSVNDLSNDHSALTADLRKTLATPFDLNADYMFRACLYIMGENEYVLAGVFHHISSDGWSQGILLSDFISLYGTYSSGLASNLPPLPLQYTDYAVWQRNHLEGAVMESQLTYWEKQLEGINTLQLPTDYARPSVQSVAGSTISFELSKALSADINAVSKGEGVTAFMTLLAAFKVLLSRYSGQNDICVGTPIANRTQKELEGMIGFFVNTLAIRSSISEDKTFRELLQEIRQTTLDAYDHQQVPFEKVVERVVKTRDMSVSPLFQVLFTLQNMPDVESSNAGNVDGLKFSHFEYLGSVTAKFDLTMTVNETDGQYAIDINYCTDLFQEDTIQRMFTHYQELLTEMVASSSIQLSEISMLQQEEKQLLLEEFNNTAINIPENQTVIDLIEKQVKKTPEAVAAVFEGESLTYQQLNERSNQLARYLVSQGVKADVLVGICIDRSIEMVVGILGILKAGGAYVPIDPEYPQSRIDYMLEDSGVQVLLSSGDCSDAFTDKDNLEVILLDSDWNSKIGKRSFKNIKRVSSPEHLAYVIYTSGSTGKPKGVLNAHKGILNLLLHFNDTYEISKEDVILQKATFSFDVSVWELLLPLINGSKLVFARPGGQGDVNYLKELIELEQITMLHFIPSMLGAFLEGLSAGDCSSLRRVLSGGEALTLDQIRRFRELFPTTRLDHTYGPTEATVDASIWQVPEDISSITKITIGKPVANTSLYVLDDQKNLVPVGVTGELYIGGVQLAKGYLNQDNLTEEQFVLNPIHNDERIYKTGDLARWLPDGTVEFIGRKDTQVKVRGYRIELGEIENALSMLPELSQSCVVVRETNGINLLVAYAVLAEGFANNDSWKETLQEQLGESLPDYMVPQLWVQLDEMPLLPNGKLDRNSLPSLDSSELSSKEYVAPRTEKEKQLVAIWQDLLEIERVGVYDNFFELGGHSLLAVRLISSIQDIGYSINVRDIFTSPTIALLSTQLTSITEVYKVPENGIINGCNYITPGMVSLVDLSQKELDSIMGQIEGGGANIQDIYPLSPLQKGIYFHHLMSDPAKGDPYVLSTPLPFTSAEQRSDFIEALNFVISRHDVLRTCILNEGLSQNVQVVLREVDLPVEELSVDSSKEFLPQLQEAVAPDKLWIDPAKAPMLQLKTADDAAKGTYYLIVCHHHLMTDHVGLEKIQQEVLMYLSGKADMLPTPALYRDFIGDTLHKEQSGESKRYFSELYEGVAEPTYPFNLSDNKVDGSVKIVSSRKMLSPELRDAVREISGTMQVSPAVLFHAAFGLVVGRCSNSDYALFGSVLLGRLQGSKGANASLGLFMNTLPVMLDLREDVMTYIHQANERLQGLLSYEQTPLSNIHSWSGISNDVPLFTALLNYRHSTRSISSGEAGNTTNSDTQTLRGEERTNYPFGFDIDDFGDDFGLKVKLTDVGIDPDLVLSYMEESIKALLESMEKSSEEAVNQISIVSEEEKSQLQEAFDNTAVNYPEDKTIIDLFEAQVTNAPEAIAAVYEGETISYQQLDERSNQLARYLNAKGVKADDLVGICISHNLEMLVGILGILKSGGAYVPIDPGYPQSRIDYILEDSGVKLVLSSGDYAARITEKDELDIILLDKEWSKIAKRSTNKPKKTYSPDNLAYVIYTSGSTGNPKGVLIEHRNVVRLFMNDADLFDFSSDDVWTLFHSFCFDFSVWEIYGALLFGGRLVIVPNTVTKDAVTFSNLLKEEGVTILNQTPGAFYALQNEFMSIAEKTAIRYVIFGGEALNPGYLANWKSQYPECKLINMYGITETTVHVTYKEITAADIESTVSTIGSAIPTLSCYILDDHLNLVPRGVVGELCIGGSGVARGYLNRETLNRERFVANPFDEDGNSRLYKSGDLGRLLPDGNIEYMGRKDTQVKVRGYRIELGEIENALSMLPDVNQCSVLAKEDSTGSNRLIAYVVMESKQDDEANWKQILQTSLLEGLPEYMVPRLWIQMDEMPLTSNGKLDKKALPELDGSTLSSNEYVAPRTELETKLVEIWQNLLGVEKVGIYDNFFELGGHSLLAVQLISTIRTELEIEIAIRDVFELYSIEQLGNYIQSIELDDDGKEDEILFEQSI